jgi:hypothetical protein
MNRADAIDLDEKSKNLESELFHAKEAWKLARETLKGTDNKIVKGEFLLKVIQETYLTNETEVLREASKKLLEVIKEL